MVTYFHKFHESLDEGYNTIEWDFLITALDSRLLGLGSFLCSRFLSSWLLSSWLLSFLGSWLLGSLRFLSLWLFSLRFLCLRLLSGELERSSSLLTSSSGRHQFLGSNHFLESQTDTDGGLGSIHLVVGHDVLKDRLAGGSLLVSQPLDGSGDHGSVGRMGSRHLGLGGLLGLRSCSFSHDEGMFDR